MKILKCVLTITILSLVGIGGYIAYRVFTDVDEVIEEKIEPRRAMAFNILDITNNEDLIAAYNEKFDGITFLVFTSDICLPCKRYKDLLSKAPQTFANKPVRVIYVYVDAMPVEHKANEILIDSSELFAKVDRTPTTYITENNNLLQVISGYNECSPTKIYHEMINFGL